MSKTASLLVSGSFALILASEVQAAPIVLAPGLAKTATDHKTLSAGSNQIAMTVICRPLKFGADFFMRKTSAPAQTHDGADSSP
jgi:hypothetical protein